MATIFKATGKDTFGCRKQLKADGFVWIEEARAWYGSQEAIDRFNARGFRVKVFFSQVDVAPSAQHIFEAVLSN